MEDSGSRASVESCPDDFVIVGGDPKLHIEGGVSNSGMKEDLKEILAVEDPSDDKNINNYDIKTINSGGINENSLNKSKESEKDINKDKELDISNNSNNDSDHNDDSSFSNIGSDVSNHNTNDKHHTIDAKENNFIDNLDKNNIVNNYNVNDNVTDNVKHKNSNNTNNHKTNAKEFTAKTTLDNNNPHNDNGDNEATTETPITTFKTTPLTVETPPTTPTTSPPSSHTTLPPSPIITIPPILLTMETYSLDEDAMMFTGVLYLGGTVIGASRSEVEVNRIIALLNNQSHNPLLISLSVPSHSDGIIYLVDPPSNTIISSYPIHQILFCARGPIDTKDSKCFAFTCSHGNAETAIFQCHVFRTDDPDVNVGKILYHFATAFRCTLKSSLSLSSSTSPPSLPCDTNEIHVNMNIDIRELDNKNQFISCPKDKDVFKLRCNVLKHVVITLTQVAGDTKLCIEKCFGVLLSAGRNVKLNSMSLLEVVGVTHSADNTTYTIAALFNPTLPHFELINNLTPKDSRVFITVAVDVVVARIRQPLKFLSEFKAVLLPSNYKFWYFSNRQYVHKFVLFVKESEELAASPNAIGCQLEVVSIENQSEKEATKNRPMISSVFSMFQNSVEPSSPQEDDFSDNDEPLLSGSGVVSKEVTDDALLDSWKDVLVKWHQNVKVKPRGVGNLVKKGIPEALRGEVWQLLVGCTEDQHMFEEYRLLIAKDSPCDDVITRDLNRTFPAHEFFQDGGGVGQESLYRICKAYSIYDTEVSYCQGVSFLTAALLLHMPEEQTFCVLVRTMYSYGLRELFRMDFEDLHLKFYQLERCIEDQMGNLHEHFLELGLEAHMFASQWFLTLFTAKFPLFLVFSILDLFFSEGMPTIFGVALALLKMSRKDLLALDFEGVLKYFRVQLPKKYRSEVAAREMVACAISMTPSERKLKRYEGLCKAYRDEQLVLQDPQQRLKKENQRLQETNLRLERENDSLARELVNSKIGLRNQLDDVEDKYECVNKELLLSRSIVLEAEEEKKMQTEEIIQLKDLCRRECQNVQNSDQRNQIIIHDYKKICTQLTSRIEGMAEKQRKEMQAYEDIIEGCDVCKTKQKASEKNKNEGESRGDTGLADNATNEKTGHVGERGGNMGDKGGQVMEKDDVIRCLELELAQTKLALVECECRNQDLIHQLTSSVSSPNLSSLATGGGVHGNAGYSGMCNINNASSNCSGNNNSTTNKASVRNSWLQKTFNSIKEATVVKASSFNAQ